MAVTRPSEHAEMSPIATTTGTPIWHAEFSNANSRGTVSLRESLHVRTVNRRRRRLQGRRLHDPYLSRSTPRCSIYRPPTTALEPKMTEHTAPCPGSRDLGTSLIDFKPPDDRGRYPRGGFLGHRVRVDRRARSWPRCYANGLWICDRQNDDRNARYALALLPP